MANENSSSPTRGADGRIQVPGSDMHPDRKKTLRDYLKGQTAGSDDISTANEFPIDGASDRDISNANPDGTPVGPDIIQQAQPHFSLNNEARKIFNDISSGAFFDVNPDTGNQIQTIAERTGIDDEPGLKNDQKFGHQAGTETYVQTVSEQVSSVLLSNRFSPPQVADETQLEFEQRNQNTIDNQKYFGDPSLTNQETRRKMAKLGVESAIAASGFIGRDPVDIEKEGLSGIWAQTFDTFNISDLANIGNGNYGIDNNVGDRLRDGTRRISEKAVLPTREWLERDSEIEVDLKYIDSEGRPSENGEIGDKENHAYTVMNSMISQFIQEELFTNRQYINGLNFMAATFIQNILLAAIFDALLALELAVQKEVRQNLRSQYDNSPVQMARGKARGNYVPLSDLVGGNSSKAGDIMELFGLPNVKDLFNGPALVEFILNFMGINKPIQAKTNLVVAGFKLGDFISFVPSYLIGSLQTTISALKDPMSAGFFFNLGRQIARKSALEAAPSPQGGALEYIRYFFDLRDQSGFRFFVTMVNLGDNAIGQFFAKWENYGGPAILNETKIAWGASSMSPASVTATPSMFLIPKSFRNFSQEIESGVVDAEGNFVSGRSLNGTGDTDQFFNPEGNDSRIDGATAALLEEKLNSEYMPFYIKDMRTNEIISFHAFLDTYSDGFSATYSGITGMGRIEPAHIYESSQRSIGISFTMIAFSEEDMDMLYWKLNKLVTLMYPQFSKGTQLIGPDQKKFYMPFSQIPTASPMVRIRIGDILTNNFSKASAARMLGVGYDEGPKIVTVDATQTRSGNLQSLIPGGGDSNKAIMQRRENFVKSLTPTVDPFVGPMTLSMQTNVNFVSQGDIVRIRMNNTKKRTGKIITRQAGLVPATIKPTLGIGIPNNVDVNSESKSTNVGLSTYSYTPDLFRIIGFEAKPTTVGEGDDKQEIIDYSNIKVWLAFFSQGTTTRNGRAVDTGDYASPTRVNTIEKLYKKSRNKPDGLCFWVPMTDIMGIEHATSPDPEALKFVQENTIVKAFENNAGEGMAGFLDNLQLDWQLNTLMWDTTPGRRAPQGCKVTLGFKPIHDITPGLDADGFNRAPVYKVGNLSRSIHKNGNLNLKTDSPGAQ